MRSLCRQRPPDPNCGIFARLFFPDVLRRNQSQRPRIEQACEMHGIRSIMESILLRQSQTYRALIDLMIRSRGFSGQSSTCFRYPLWYVVNASGSCAIMSVASSLSCVYSNSLMKRNRDAFSRSAKSSWKSLLDADVFFFFPLDFVGSGLTAALFSFFVSRFCFCFCFLLFCTVSLIWLTFLGLNFGCFFGGFDFFETFDNFSDLLLFRRTN